MNRLQFDGAWEGDCLPLGNYVAAYPDGRLITHMGPWSAPVWLRYPRMSPITNYVAGTTQSNPARCVEVRPDGWSDVAPACGNSACAYGPGGELIINMDCGHPYYGLGIRYISDRVYTGADTYMDHERHIYEWTEHDSITVGQNGKGPYGEDPCVILYNGRRYLLEGGTCRVIRFSKQGDKLSIGFFRVDVGAFVAHWLTVAEIAELKDITDQEEPEEPGEPEEPEGPVDFPRTEWGIVEQMHAKFARTRPATEDGAREWTRMAIEQLAFSFPSGGWCWKSASPDRPPSKDCIARRIEGRFQGWDVLQSAGVNGPHVLARFPPSFHDLIAEGNQHPIPVNSKNHLGTELDEPTEPGQATLDKIYADTQAILALLQKQFK